MCSGANQIKKLVVHCFIFFLCGSMYAKDLKIGYINSTEIFAGYEGTTDLQSKYDQEIAKWNQKMETKQKEIRDLNEKLENRSLLMSKEAKEKLKKEIKRKMGEYEQFVNNIFGRGGKAFKKNEEYTKPILKKIKETLKVMRKEEGFDFIFDTVAGGIVEADPKYNLTKKVLDKINAAAK